jgi:hypothetical protein
MSKFIGYESCPRCQSQGRDKAGDNLGRYSDGGGHCFSCGYHESPKRKLIVLTKEVEDAPKAVLPSDFTREVPAEGWKWILQYGLPYSYWKKYCGYSPSHNRLVITFGEPIRFSIGRALSEDKRKWRFWGEGHKYVEILGEDDRSPIVLVEDLISTHKVAQVAPCMCLFGTHIHDVALEKLLKAKRPVIVWLDADQYTLLPAKINRLQTFLRHPVRYITTEKDPKEYSLTEIKDFLK